MENTKQMTFPIWETVKIGTLGDYKTARARLERASIRIGHIAERMLYEMAYADHRAELDLVKVGLSYLIESAFTDVDEIYVKAGQYGLSLCPHEVAPQLWLQCPNQIPQDEGVLIAMHPIWCSESCCHEVFRLASQSGLQWLISRYGAAGDHWPSKASCIFVRER